MTRIYAFFAAAGAILIAIFSAFRFVEKSTVNRIKAEREEAASEYRQAGSEALIGGLEKEQEKISEAKNSTDRTDRSHFE